MRVIDLLNKIANGEEVPKKIKFKGIDRIYEYDRLYNWFDDNSSDNCKDIFYICELNDEVEIIEEDKKIEKIDNAYYHETQDRQNEIFKNKINEIIDYINKGDK